MLVGAVLTLLGYGGMWLCAANPQLGSFGLLWIFWFLWGHGSGYFDAAVIATSAHNFPGARGKVMGVVKAFYGLSGSLLTQSFRAIFPGEGQGEQPPPKMAPSLPRLRSERASTRLALATSLRRAAAMSNARAHVRSGQACVVHRAWWCSAGVPPLPRTLPGSPRRPHVQLHEY